MCRFTTLTYTCGHTILLTTARHTLLCITALGINMEQGIDTTPASCFPLPSDISNHEKICAKNQEFSACAQCISSYSMRAYNEADTQAPTALEAQIEEWTRMAVRAITLFQSRDDMNAKTAFITHDFLHTTLSSTQPETFTALFLDDLRQAREWVPVLRRCVERNAHRDMWDATLAHVSQHMDAAKKKISLFCQVLEELDGFDMADVGASQRRLFRLGSRLEQAVWGRFLDGHGGGIARDLDSVEYTPSSPGSEEIELTPRSPEVVDLAMDMQSDLFAISFNISSSPPPQVQITPLAMLVGQPACSCLAALFKYPSPARRGPNPLGLTVQIYPPPQSENLPRIVHCVVPDAW